MIGIALNVVITSSGGTLPAASVGHQNLRRSLRLQSETRISRMATGIAQTVAITSLHETPAAGVVGRHAPRSLPRRLQRPAASPNGVSPSRRWWRLRWKKALCRAIGIVRHVETTSLHAMPAAVAAEPNGPRLVRRRSYRGECSRSLKSMGLATLQLRFSQRRAKPTLPWCDQATAKNLRQAIGRALRVVTISLSGTPRAASVERQSRQCQRCQAQVLPFVVQPPRCWRRSSRATRIAKRAVTSNLATGFVQGVETTNFSATKTVASVALPGHPRASQ